MAFSGGISSLLSDGVRYYSVSAFVLFGFAVLISFLGKFAEVWAGKRRRLLEDVVGTKEWVKAEYKWEPGVYYPCQVLQQESALHDTYTIKFTWGCLQPSTRRSQIDLAPFDPPTDDAGASDPIAEQENDEASVSKQLTIWSAVRAGDLDAVKRLVRVLPDINALEPIRGRDGRSALYWACITGRVAIVEYLLAQGATDEDGSAFLAATCAEPVRAKSDMRDLLFDPDENVYTDFVEREVVALTDGSDETSKKIRALLVAARVEGLVPAPKVVFDRPVTNACIVCYEDLSLKPGAVCSPCGHSSSCLACLEAIRESLFGGCPECRAHIREIIPVADADAVEKKREQMPMTIK